MMQNIRKVLLPFVILVLAAIVGCGSCGSKSDEQTNPPGPFWGEDPADQVFVFSAFDGNDYEIYTYKPSTNEFLQLTDSDTNDFSGALTGDVFAWACDDGAGSELCTRKGDGTFTQATAIAGDGALGATVLLPSIKISPDASRIFTSSNSSYSKDTAEKLLIYDLADSKFQQKNILDLLQVPDVNFIDYAFYSGSPSLGPTALASVNGAVYNISDYSSQFQTRIFFINAKGEADKIDLNNITSSINHTDGWLAIARDQTSEKDTLYNISSSDGSVTAIEKMGSGIGYFCKKRNNDYNIRDYPSSKPYTDNILILQTDSKCTYGENLYTKCDGAFLKLYLYQKSDKTLKLVIDETANTGQTPWSCLQDGSGGKVLFQQNTYDDTTKKQTSSLRLLDIASGTESKFDVGESPFIKDYSYDLSSVVVGTRIEDKAKVFIIASGKMSEADGKSYSGNGVIVGNNFIYNKYTSNALAETAVVDASQQNAVVYSLASGETAELSMPLLNSESCGSSVILNKRECPAGVSCYSSSSYYGGNPSYDSRIKYLYKIYRADKGDTIDLALDGKDIANEKQLMSINCAGLSPEQYGKLKELANNVELKKKMKPEPDTGSVVFKAPHLLFKWGSDVYVLSKNKDAKFSLKLTPWTNDNSSFQAKGYYPLLPWQSAVAYTSAVVYTLDTAYAPPSIRNGDKLTLTASDGTTSVSKEVIAVGFGNGETQNQPPVLGFEPQPDSIGKISCSAPCEIKATATDSDGIVTKIDIAGDSWGTGSTGCNQTNTCSFIASGIATSQSITFKATDDQGGVTTKTIQVEILPPFQPPQNQPPTLYFDPQPDANDKISCSAPCKIKVTAVDPDGGIVTGVGATVGSTLIGNTIGNQTNTCSFTTPDITTSQQITFKATDDQGGVTTKTISVKIIQPPQNRPPVLSFDPIPDASDTISCYAPYAPCEIKVTATDSDGTVTKIDITRGSLLLNRINCSGATPCSHTVSGITAAQQITFKATDDQGGVTTKTISVKILSPKIAFSVPADSKGEVICDINGLRCGFTCSSEKPELCLLEAKIMGPQPTEFMDDCAATTCAGVFKITSSSPLAITGYPLFQQDTGDFKWQFMAKWSSGTSIKRAITFIR